MLIENEFEIEADLTTTWELLTDLERVIPCMPGARYLGRENESVRGDVTVKVGPITANLEGLAAFTEQDKAEHRAVITARGRDKRGQASASARVNARLDPESPSTTRVTLRTDLEISGRLAQFGRGVIVDISNRLLEQFVANLQSELQREGPTTARSSVDAVVPTPAADSAEESAVSLDGGAIVRSMLKERIGQTGLALIVGIVLGMLFGKRTQPRAAGPEHLVINFLPPGERPDARS